MSEALGRTINGQWRKGNRSWALAALCVSALSARGALAQEDPNAAETAAARSIALEGIRLADAGRCAEALEKLSRAEKLHHALVVLGRLGECQVNQGKLVDGTENLRRVLREPLPSNASSVLLKARERAQGVLDTAKPRIGALNIAVKGPRDNTGVSVTLDGVSMPVALLDADRPTDPGDHVVEASATGYLRASGHVTVAPGDRQSIVLKLEPDPNAPVAATASPPSAEAAGSSTRAAPASEPAASASIDSNVANSRGEVDHTGAYIAWAAGGAAVAVGSVFGIMAFKGKGDLNEQCPDKVCLESSQDRLDSAKRASTISTVLFAVGGASIGLGTVLFLTASPSGGSSRSARASAASTPPGAPLQARAWIGIGQVGVTGRF